MIFGSLVMGLAMLFVGPTDSLQSSLPPSITTTVIGNGFAYLGIACVVTPVPKALHISMRSTGFANSLETSSLIASIYNGMWFVGGCFGPTISGAMMDARGYAFAATIMSIIAFILSFVLTVGDILDRTNYCGKRKSRFQEYAALHESSKTISIFHSQRI